MTHATQPESITGLTRGEVAHRLRLSPERVAQMARAGLLTFTITPLGRLFDVACVEAVAAERERRANQAAAR